MEFLSSITAVFADWLTKDGLWQTLTFVVAILGGILLLLSYVVDRWAKVFFSISSRLDHLENKPPKDYRDQVYRDTDISRLLKTIKHDTGADRVGVYQYHNGERSIANNPFLKFSCTHENLKQTARSVQKYMTNMPISIFGEWNRSIFDGKSVACNNINDLQSVSDMRTAQQTLRVNGVVSIYLFPLRDPVGRTFGFGTIEYCCDPTTLNDKWRAWAAGQYKMVGALLSQSVIDE